MHCNVLIFLKSFLCILSELPALWSTVSSDQINGLKLG